VEEAPTVETSDGPFVLSMNDEGAFQKMFDVLQEKAVEKPLPEEDAELIASRFIDHDECALYCFTPDSDTRIFAQQIVNLESFDFFIVLVILVSSITLALEEPNASQETKDLVRLLDIVFMCIFSVEMLLKMCAYGIWWTHPTYVVMAYPGEITSTWNLFLAKVYARAIDEDDEYDEVRLTVEDLKKRSVEIKVEPNPNPILTLTLTALKSRLSHHTSRIRGIV